MPAKKFLETQRARRLAHRGFVILQNLQVVGDGLIGRITNHGGDPRAVRERLHDVVRRVAVQEHIRVRTAGVFANERVGDEATLGQGGRGGIEAGQSRAQTGAACLRDMQEEKW